MNLFDLGGQYLRVGRAITPPDTKNQGPPSAIPQVMPTAAAVAAAAATAKIQAMDAVASNLGLKATELYEQQQTTKPPPPPMPAPQMVQPDLAPPGLINIPSNATAPQMPTSIPPPPLPPGPPILLPEEPKQPTPPPVTQPPPPPTPASSSSHPVEVMKKVEAEAQKKQQEELQKKLMEGQEPATLQQQENMSIKGQSARHLVMQKLMRTQSESVVVVLKNMVSPDEVDEELNDEISEECSKFGEVERVIIYQERQSEEDDAETIVKIFVEFKEAKAAKAAKSALNGRFFGGRRISCEIYDQDLYDHSDFSG